MVPVVVDDAATLWASLIAASDLGENLHRLEEDIRDQSPAGSPLALSLTLYAKEIGTQQDAGGSAPGGVGKAPGK